MENTFNGRYSTFPLYILYPHIYFFRVKLFFPGYSLEYSGFQNGVNRGEQTSKIMVITQMSAEESRPFPSVPSLSLSLALSPSCLCSLAQASPTSGRDLHVSMLVPTFFTVILPFPLLSSQQIGMVLGEYTHRSFYPQQCTRSSPGQQIRLDQIQLYCPCTEYKY